MLKGESNTSMKLPWLTLLTGVVAVLVFVSPVGVASGLQLDRGAVFQGAYWQLLTGHLTHWSFDHLIWDLAMFGILGVLVEARSRKAWIRLNLISALAVSLSVIFIQAELEFYRGLSGLDMALAGYWFVVMFQDCRLKGRSNESWMWGAALVLLFSKALFEIVLGNALFVSNLGDGVVNVPLAHLAGAAVGVVFWRYDRKGARSALCLSRGHL